MVPRMVSAAPGAPDDVHAPTVSVIVPAYGMDAQLHGCVAQLVDQELDDHVEVVVYSSADSADDLPELEPHPRLRVISSEQRVGAAIARNRAAAVATGDVLVFTDADVTVPPGWLAEIVAAVAGAGDDVVVAGAVSNGTPANRVGAAQHLLEFLDFHPDRPGRRLRHGATCNLAVSRRAWERYGPFVEDLDGGEDTLLTTAAHRDGRLRFAPRAVVHHQNRTSVRDMLSHVRSLGRKAAHVARRGGYPVGALVGRTAVAPLVGATRAVLLVAKLTTWGRSHRRTALWSAPYVVSGLVVWSLGLWEEGRRIDARRREPVDVRTDSVTSTWEEQGLVPDALPEGWRRHARAAHLELLTRWLGGTDGVWLKTDLQEERFAARSLLPRLDGAWIGVDIAASVAAAVRSDVAVAAAADVRALPFGDASFDGILSTSTLDHFVDAADIEVSLREFRRILGPGGRLVLTLDNPQNPLVWVRNALPSSVQRRTGLVPFDVGHTLSATKGVEALSRTGFLVDRVEHLLHTPHVVGTRAARWAPVERWVLPTIDRLRATGLAPRTGHYVAFLARRPPEGD